MRLCYSIVTFMALIMLTVGISVISGCGKKGPLYHPAEVQAQKAKEKANKTPTNTSKQP